MKQYSEGQVKVLELLAHHDNVSLMVAPSFVVDFDYKKFVPLMKGLGFDFVCELTFGAKLVNREYHKLLKKCPSGCLMISSVCPGVVSLINNKFSKLKKNLILIDSPMVAMAKVCKKIYPKHNVVFISPCEFKKQEAEGCKEIDFVINFNELKEIFAKKLFKREDKNLSTSFDRFYNDYTKIYPLAGGLSKTAHLKNILTNKESISIDGIKRVETFLKKGNFGKLKFLDVNFCVGGCVGGPYINSSVPLVVKKLKVRGYLRKSKQEDIPEIKKGLVKKAKGISLKK